MTAPTANWSYPTAVRFGPGRIKELPDACRVAGISRPLLVTDAGLAKLPNLLVVNPRFDPITPLVNAEIVQDLWRGSTLVTYEGWGHTAAGSNTCVDAIVDRYLTTGRTPRQRDV